MFDYQFFFFLSFNCLLYSLLYILYSLLIYYIFFIYLFITFFMFFYVMFIYLLYFRKLFMPLTINLFLWAISLITLTLKYIPFSKVSSFIITDFSYKTQLLLQHRSIYSCLFAAHISKDSFCTSSDIICTSECLIIVQFKLRKELAFELKCFWKIKVFFFLFIGAIHAKCDNIKNFKID